MKSISKYVVLYRSNFQGKFFLTLTMRAVGEKTNIRINQRISTVLVITRPPNPRKAEDDTRKPYSKIAG